MSLGAHRVAGRVVIVTGASAGIGRATAERLVKHGAVVIGAARDEARLAQIPGMHPVGCDVRDPASRRALVEQVITEHGRIDALVNNAGLGFEGLLEDMTLDDVDRLVETNVTGLIDLCRLVLPGMLTRGSGDIVNVASVVSFFAAPPLGVYAATKFAVDGFTQALRREVWSRGVKVHGIHPGPVATEFGLVARSTPIEPGSVPAASEGVPAWWVAVAIERCLIWPYPRTASVPRALGLVRLATVPGIRNAIDVSTTLPLGRRVRPTTTAD